MQSMLMIVIYVKIIDSNMFLSLGMFCIQLRDICTPW